MKNTPLGSRMYSIDSTRVVNTPVYNMIMMYVLHLNFVYSWDDCLEVVKLHHLVNPYSTIADQATRNNLKGFSLLRVSM